MSRDSSPPTDDSAVGSMSSSVIRDLLANPTNSTSSNYIVEQPHHHKQLSSQETSTASIPPRTAQMPQTIRTSQSSLLVNNQSFPPKNKSAKNNLEPIGHQELIHAAKQMRRTNVSLISRSIRTQLSCFDDLDIDKFETNGDFFVNFVSNGIFKCTQNTILRPVSILWPYTYDKMVEQLGLLDAFLLNTDFHDKPIDWMLSKGITGVPNCRLCKSKMTLDSRENLVRWHCKKFPACKNYFMPLQRPSFFNGFEKIKLKKLLFAVYYWATCTPAEDLKHQLNIDQLLLNKLWRKIQNVCRIALEKSYPRHRLTDCLDQEQALTNGNHEGAPNQEEKKIPIDLISIKINRVYVVCAKHPGSNLVRVGYYIPKVSLYSFGELTETWFAHGASIRISESKFMELAKRRTDLKIHLVDRSKILAKDGKFDRDSAFGYLITQLTHVFKDYDSTGLSVESLKMMLAELQWRELYGTKPFDAFTNIINHMSQYGDDSEWYSELVHPVCGEETYPTSIMETHQSIESSQYIWAEKYYYGSVEPLDKDGNIISGRLDECSSLDNMPPPTAYMTCHLCKRKFESFDFTIHLIHHIEMNRKECEREEYLIRNLIECKHCFKIYKKDQIITHSTLLRTFLHPMKFGCRICCIRLENRDQFIMHMRRKHFEHETPYRCPSCKYSSSFQRDVFLHFAEEHRHQLIVLCTLCLRSFTIAKPEEMNNIKMRRLSKIVYNHLAEHYVLSKRYTCSNCCLCFLDSEQLKQHIRKHHDPCEIRESADARLEPFILDRDEEKNCVKALTAELFIANKRPNLKIDRKRVRRGERQSTELAENSLSDSDSSECEDDVRRSLLPGQKRQSNLTNDKNANNNEEEEVDSSQDGEDGVIHVRGLTEAKKFLVGGSAALTIPKSRAITAKQANGDQSRNCSSQHLIDFLSKMKRVDGVIPNQSVILTPMNKPAKCCECLQYVTIEHYVSPITCVPCKYTTLCPRAATSHYKSIRHSDDKK